MRKIIGIHILLLFSVMIYAQNKITAVFPVLANQPIKLIGFNGLDTYTIDSITANAQGVFELAYSPKDYGVGYLLATDNTSFFVVLTDENIKLQGKSLAQPDSIEVTKGKENQLFVQYAAEHPRREQVLVAWLYLERIYAQDSLFAAHATPKQAIVNEKQRIKTEDSLFLTSLSPDAYLRYYLPLRTLVSSVSTIAQYRTKDIPPTIEAFRKIDYTDRRLMKSGLLADVVESHFWLIENSGRSLDAMYIDMQRSIDILVENLLSDEWMLNEVSEYLFKLLEQRSLFAASEYLALKLLSEQSCTINNDFLSQLESYRAMKKGNIAPDFEFDNDVVAPGYKLAVQPNKLSDLKNKYTVIVFGAAWCPQCPQELTKITKLYNKWKRQDVEVVFVSLDQDKQLFERFTAVFPFISICDYLKWESPVVQNYHVFVTPTIYLLDNQRKILLRPGSVNHLDAWIEWYLVQGHKK